jgi:hypothetical protein
LLLLLGFQLLAVVVLKDPVEGRAGVTGGGVEAPEERDMSDGERSREMSSLPEAA